MTKPVKAFITPTPFRSEIPEAGFLNLEFGVAYSIFVNTGEHFLFGIDEDGFHFFELVIVDCEE